MLLETLLSLDESIFFAINEFENSLLDWLLPFYRHKLVWVPLYTLIISLILWNMPKSGLWLILFTLLTVGLSDTVSSKFIKKSVERLRPCNDSNINDQVISRIRCGGGYSFTSSHAANHGALAFFFFFLFRGPNKWWQWLLVVWAVTIGISQIYVGVHYPLDVLGGLMVGLIIGFFMSRLSRKLVDIPEMESIREE